MPAASSVARSASGQTTPSEIPASEPSKTKFSSKKTAFLRLRRLLLTKKAGAIAAIFVLGIAGYSVAQSATSANTPENVTFDPGYQTILPSGKSIGDLGGWRRVSPPEKDPVYAYVDRIDGIAINISQQPLPKDFQASTKEHVAELAKKFNATTEIDASGTTVYIGTSAKGPQSVIFTKNNLLILIKSQQKIDNTSWQRYAESLNESRY